MYEMQPTSVVKLQQVHPLLSVEIKLLAKEFYIATGDEIIVTEGLRDWNRQLELWQQGRTIPGEVVTNAQPGHSWHQFGLAVDVAPMIAGVLNWNPGHPVWKQLIALSDQHTNLVHVNLNRTKRDWPHFQMTGLLPVSPDDATRDIYQKRLSEYKVKYGVALDTLIRSMTLDEIWHNAFPDYVLPSRLTQFDKE